jgi:hypothetical protein
MVEGGYFRRSDNKIGEFHTDGFINISEIADHAADPSWF